MSVLGPLRYGVYPVHCETKPLWHETTPGPATDTLIDQPALLSMGLPSWRPLASTRYGIPTHVDGRAPNDTNRRLHVSMHRYKQKRASWLSILASTKRSRWQGYGLDDRGEDG